ncbi:MAG: GGDEF domain-containing protein, partial [Gallionella sp.]
VQAGTRLAVAVMDIDFFKKINDRYGHDGGDAVLKNFAALMGAHFKNILVARVGGEEFFLLFEEPDKAAGYCEEFRRIVEQATTPFGDENICFTISIGITCQASCDLDDMLNHADKNLYHAKQSGRNRIVAI